MKRNLAIAPAALPAPVGPDEIQQYISEQREPFRGSSTPLASWNAVCSGGGGKGQGLAPGWLVTIGGGPGHRKSWFVCNLAAHALQQGQGVLYMSGELSRSEVIGRVARCITGTTFGVSDKDPTWIEAAAEQLQDLVVNDVRVNVPASEVFAAAKQYAGMGIALIIVDYAQQMLESAVRTADELKTFVEEFRGMAIEHDFTGVLVSQLTRESVRDRAFDMPDTWGLGGGASLERHSDQVVLFGFSYSRERKAAYDHVRAWVAVKKNRYGWPIHIPVVWDSRTMQLTEGPTLGDMDFLREWPELKKHEKFMLQKGVA